MDRVFLDANILFSAAYRPGAKLHRLWVAEAAELITSPYAIEEARRNLTTSEQRRRLARLLIPVRVVRPAVLPGRSGPRCLPAAVTLPAKDWPILRAAIGARATHLLTGDFKHFGLYYGQRIGGILILPPSEYPPLSEE